VTGRRSKPQEREIMASKRHPMQDVRKRWARRRSASLSANTEGQTSRGRSLPEMPNLGRLMRRWRGGK
jgi:hypothetical protein